MTVARGSPSVRRAGCPLGLARYYVSVIIIGSMISSTIGSTISSVKSNTNTSITASSISTTFPA